MLVECDDKTARQRFLARLRTEGDIQLFERRLKQNKHLLGPLKEWLQANDIEIVTVGSVYDCQLSRGF
jgi:hypothetical protein